MAGELDPGRRKLTQITIRLTPAVYDALREDAKRNRRSMAAEAEYIFMQHFGIDSATHINKHRTPPER